MNSNKKKTIILVFSYEELNINVLLNSAIFNARLNSKFNYVAYTPIGFKTLFFAADQIIEIPREIDSFNRYSEVAEYGVNSAQFYNLKSRIWEKLNKLIFSILAKGKISDHLLVGLIALTRTPRSDKFLYKSGVFKWVKSDAKVKFKNNYVVVPAQNYIKIDGDRILFQSKSLTENFKYLFEEHEKALSKGLRINIDSVKSYEKKAFIRTRQYARKQPISRGWHVSNVGSPALLIEKHLNDSEKCNFSEYNDILSIDEEFNLLRGPVICRADAGLFVLAAALPLPLICLTSEWSDYLGVSLLQARKKSGWNSDLAFNPGITSIFRADTIVNFEI